MSARVASVLALALPAAGRASGVPGQWTFVRADQGIEVHRRDVPGSSLGEFRGRALIEATPAQVLAVLRDADARVEWMNRCVASRLVERADPATEVTYNRTRGSWPIADRDAVLRVRTRFEPERGRVFIAFHSVEHAGAPPVAGVVRMPEVRGHWILAPERAGAWTFVEYQVYAAPGGRLPAWVAQLVSRNVPHRTIARLRRQVARRSYPEVEAAILALPAYRQVVQGPAVARPTDDPQP